MFQPILRKTFFLIFFSSFSSVSDNCIDLHQISKIDFFFQKIAFLVKNDLFGHFLYRFYPPF